MALRWRSRLAAKSIQRSASVLVAAGTLLLVACGSGAAAEPESTPDEVRQAFAQWLCPGSPDYALSTYQPFAEFDDGEWRVSVAEGTLRAREPQLVFVWDKPRLGNELLTMRTEEQCEE